MSWVGGKKALRDIIIARFPLRYKTYVEVFGGAGWVLFRKPPGKDIEIFNDFNDNLVNLYRCVREHAEALIEELRFMLNSRSDFEYMKKMINSKAVLPDIRRAAYYYALIRYSYAAGVDSFGGRPHSLWRDFPRITAASRRLQTVTVENKDCVDLLQYSEMHWDHSYSVTAYSKNNNPNYSLRVATQVLIYEIVTGLRDASSFERLDSNGYSDGRVLYDAFILA